MEDLKISYNEENDDLLMYLEGSKSAGAVEIGNFVLDFDEKENLVGIQILNASEVLSKLISKMVSLTQIKGAKAKIINFRNMEAISLEVDFGSGIEKIPIIIPRVKEGSPVLRY
jgi:uncharacterized protein YuzE